MHPFRQAVITLRSDAFHNAEWTLNTHVWLELGLEIVRLNYVSTKNIHLFQYTEWMGILCVEMPGLRWPCLSHEHPEFPYEMT